MLPTSRFSTPSVGGYNGEGVNHPTTHVEACMEMSRDAGSIPAASTQADLREIVSRLFSWTLVFIELDCISGTQCQIMELGIFFSNGEVQA
jgi:hypothetical protein